MTVCSCSIVSHIVRLGMDSVSCSPFRVPMARLGVAQSLLASGRVHIDDVTFDFSDESVAVDDAEQRTDLAGPAVEIDEALVLHTLRVRGFVTSDGFSASIGAHSGTCSPNWPQPVTSATSRLATCTGCSRAARRFTSTCRINSPTNQPGTGSCARCRPGRRRCVAARPAARVGATRRDARHRHHQHHRRGRRADGVERRRWSLSWTPSDAARPRPTTQPRAEPTGPGAGAGQTTGSDRPDRNRCLAVHRLRDGRLAARHAPLDGPGARRARRDLRRARPPRRVLRSTPRPRRSSRRRQVDGDRRDHLDAGRHPHRARRPGQDRVPLAAAWFQSAPTPSSAPRSIVRRGVARIRRPGSHARSRE